jgi:hypothetical protein
VNAYNSLAAAAAAVLSIALTCQPVFAQGFGTAPRGTGVGQDTTDTGSANNQRQGTGAHASSDKRMKGHHEGQSADRPASGPAGSAKMSQ